MAPFSSDKSGEDDHDKINLRLSKKKQFLFECSSEIKNEKNKAGYTSIQSRTVGQDCRGRQRPIQPIHIIGARASAGPEGPINCYKKNKEIKKRGIKKKIKIKKTKKLIKRRKKRRRKKKENNLRPKTRAAQN